MRDYLLLHLVILAWGFTAILGKLIELPAVDVVLWRTLISAVGFGLLARVLGKPLRAGQHVEQDIELPAPADDLQGAFERPGREAVHREYSKRT